MSNLFNLDRVLILKEKLGWDTVFIAIDLHDTIVYGKLHPRYKSGQFDYFQHATDVLKHWTETPWIKLILFSSSSEKHINDFLTNVAEYGVKFDYVNKNPECSGTTKETANFGEKFYYNVLLDDRAGFNGDEDWAKIKLLFKYPLWVQRPTMTHVKTDVMSFDWNSITEDDLVYTDGDDEITIYKDYHKNHDKGIVYHAKIPKVAFDIIADGAVRDLLDRD
jgi:hypothetical protein